MANPNPPLSNVRRDYAKWSFDGEIERQSPLKVQNMLTNLGYRIERNSSTNENGGHRRMFDTVDTLSLKPDRMRMLTSAQKLKIRNGADFAAVIYLVNHCNYCNTVEVMDVAMRTKLVQMFAPNKRHGVIDFTVQEPEYDSDSPEFLNLIPNDEFDNGNRSSDSADSSDD